MSCERKRREIENLYNEKKMLEAIVTEFKNNNEDYLEIEQAAEEKVKDILTNSKILLQFAIFSVIESLRSNPELYNFVIYDNSNNTTIRYGSNYPSLMPSGQQQKQQQSFNDTYTALILEESEKLYYQIIKELTNRVIAAPAAVAINASSSLPLPSSGSSNNR